MLARIHWLGEYGIESFEISHIILLKQSVFQETEEGHLQNHFHNSPNSVKIKEGLNYANSDADYIRSKESTFSCDGSDVNPIVMVIHVTK